MPKNQPTEYIAAAEAALAFHRSVDSAVTLALAAGVEPIAVLRLLANSTGRLAHLVATSGIGKAETKAEIDQALNDGAWRAYAAESEPGGSG